MTHAQFMRLETKAGGVACTNRAFISACHAVLLPDSRTRAMRAVRHDWINAGLALKARAQRLAV